MANKTYLFHGKYVLVLLREMTRLRWLLRRAEREAEFLDFSCVTVYVFLGATKHLYNWLCPLVCLSVCLSVGNAFVRRSSRRTLLAYLALLGIIGVSAKIKLLFCFDGQTMDLRPLLTLNGQHKMITSVSMEQKDVS